MTTPARFDGEDTGVKDLGAMTVYQCSECGQVHDTATDPPCPQTIKVNVPAADARYVAFGSPQTPDDSVPAWRRRYFCPQCPPPGVGQPVQGFTIPEFMEHLSGHSVAHVYEALDSAERASNALRKLEELLAMEFAEQWPALAWRRDVAWAIHAGLHWKDDAHLEAFRAKYLTAVQGPEMCSACGHRREGTSQAG